MELPALKLPQIELPFDIPVLMHPPVDHIAIAIPILVLVIEIINLVAKKRAIGVISFLLLLIGMVAAAAAYLTGTVDGKEAFDALSKAGQAELQAHKLLGTYLLLASAVVVVFKLLSAIIQRGLMKATYMLVLIVFTAGILKQGKDGGELVYKYGANIEKVQELDSELFDAQEELEALQEKIASAKKEIVQKVSEAKKAVRETVTKTVEKSKKTVESAKKEAAEVVQEAKEAGKEVTEEVTKAVEETKEKVNDMAETLQTPVLSAEKASDNASAAVQSNTEQHEAVVEKAQTTEHLKEDNTSAEVPAVETAESLSH